ncbi:CocE/NonD family hydrolase [Kineosporia babensis]|uniref:CocE/NonD family hydrolase n=1 Tax=Kineosporia babensis TaxID=499548 RepID=A0A9X1NCQ6_9ACTN|nr:CocE/NonD family hydrolase [Kineosporia babensis]
MNSRKRTTVATIGALVAIASLGLSSTATASATTAAPPDGVTHAENPRVPEGAVWTEEYFPSSDGSGVELHADVLRPEGLSAKAKTPVILAVGPYFSHAGQTGPEGFTQTGPSARFEDFTSGADIFAKGYTYVMVDLRGFGGSTGCLDWMGDGEQADIKAAVQWAAKQPWSTGKVGMYGKSYDAVTGLAGNNLKLPALKAVVAQEPLWDMYPYLFSNGVPRPNVTGTPNAYNSIVTMAPLADDTDRYKANARYEQAHPECTADNLTNNNNPDPESAYWRERDLAKDAKGTNTPLFVTQGFIENNTKPEEMELFLDNHQGIERGWVGQWEHVRGNETNSAGQLLMGRAGFFDEVMRFYDQHLKGVKPAVKDPAYLVEDNTGQWREQSTWPKNTSTLSASLPNGEYLDNGAATTLAARSAPGDEGFDMENYTDPAPSAARTATELAATTNSYFSWSKPATQRTRITATPGITFNAGATGNVMVKLWDVAPDGTAVMFDENVALITKKGKVSFDLKSTDWTFEKDHQLGVQIGTIGSGSWRDVPSGNTIRVTKAQLDLELQNPKGDKAAQGDRSPFLDTYLRQYTRTLTEVGAGTFPLGPRTSS